MSMGQPDTSFLSPPPTHNQSHEELQFLTADLGDTSSHAPIGHPNASMGGEAAPGPLGFIKQSRHPTASAFHLLFKTLALVFYLFSGTFANFIFVNVLCILLLAFDFWTVKNVTGRLLVGLRWWNYVREDGNNEWVFESLDSNSMGEISHIDSRIFWGGLYSPVVVWGLLFVLGAIQLKIQQLVIVVVALSLSIANIVGYTKCSKEAKQKMQMMMDQGGAMGNVVGAIGASRFLSGMASMMGTAATAQQQQQPAASSYDVSV